VAGALAVLGFVVESVVSSLSELSSSDRLILRLLPMPEASLHRRFCGSFSDEESEERTLSLRCFLLRLCSGESLCCCWLRSTGQVLFPQEHSTPYELWKTKIKTHNSYEQQKKNSPLLVVEVKGDGQFLSTHNFTGRVDKEVDVGSLDKMPDLCIG
jgi:hypothetical protein